MITAMPRIAIAARDFDGLVATFRDRLGLPVVDLSPSTVGSLGARLGMCIPPGGSNIELMSPAAPDAPLAQSLQGFLDRRGDGLFALMLEAPDPEAEAERLAAGGLRVLPRMASAGGRDVHPSSTHGVLVRVYPDGSFRPPEGASTESQLGLSGIESAIIAVHDLDGARAAWADGFGLAADAEAVDAERGIRRVRCQPPKGGVIDLVAVHDATRPFAQEIERFLADGRPGLFALELTAVDGRRVREGLEGAGLALSEVNGAPDRVELNPAATFGARIRIRVG